VPVVGLWRPRWPFWLALAAIAGSASVSAWALATVIDSGTLRYTLGGWAPPLGIEYVVDHVAAFVATVVTGVALMVVVSTRQAADREMRGRLGFFYSLVLLLIAGLTGIVVTGDLFNIFVFLEISSLAAYALIFLGGRRGMVAGYRYLILGSIGGSFYLLGVAFLYFTTGTLNMADTLAILREAGPSTPVSAGAVFIFIGLGLKMALVPLHLWLPDAYTYAPSSVSALIAPIATKVGAYVMIRMFLSVFPNGYLTDEVPIGTTLIVVGIAGMVFGSVAAMGQRDIRRMLAYSSISQVGLIAVGIGLATPLGFVAALLHIMNHAIMKATLFLASASVRLTTGASEIEGMAGIARGMPITMTAFAIGAVSMIGIPPSVGFFSKWYLSLAAIEEGRWVVVVFVLMSSLLSAVYLFRVLERAFLAPFSPPVPEYLAIAGATPAAPLLHGAAGLKANSGEPPHAVEPSAATMREPAANVTLPIVILAAATIVLGVLNVVVVTTVLEPGV